MLTREDQARIRAEEIFREEVRAELVRGRPPPDATAGREYARKLFDNVLAWYTSADTKAQVVLTLDGVFVAFLTGSVFAEPRELGRVLERFTPLTWGLLAAMALLLAGSIVCALLCLWSRLYSGESLDRRMTDAGVRVGDGSTYVAERSWFFQDVLRLHPEQLARRLETADAAFEVRALAEQAHELAANVEKKHLWVNRAFRLAGGALVLFMAAGASYLASF